MMPLIPHGHMGGYDYADPSGRMFYCIWPRDIDAGEFEWLEDWFALMLRQAKRQVERNEAKANAVTELTPVPSGGGDEAGAKP